MSDTDRSLHKSLNIRRSQKFIKSTNLDKQQIFRVSEKMQTRDISVSNKRSNDNLSVIKSTLIENNKALIRRMAESKSTSKERSKNRTKGTKNIDKHKNPTISIKRSNVNFINKVYYNNQENVGDQTSSITPTS